MSRKKELRSENWKNWRSTKKIIMVMMIELNLKRKNHFKSVIKLVNQWVCVCVRLVLSSLSCTHSQIFFIISIFPFLSLVINYCKREISNTKNMHTNYFLHIFCVHSLSLSINMRRLSFFIVQMTETVALVVHPGHWFVYIERWRNN